MNRPISFYSKLLLFFLLVSVIPLLIIGAITYGFSKRFFQEQYSMQTQQKVAAISERFDLLAEEYRTILGTLSDLPEARQALISGDDHQRKNIEQRMHLLLAGKKHKPALYIIRADGSLHFSTSPLPAMYYPQKHRGWGIFRTAHRQEGEMQVYPQTYEAPGRGRVVLSLVQTVHSSSGAVLGYMIVDVTRSHLLDLISADDTPYAMDFIVIDEHGFTLVDTRYPEREGTLRRAADEPGSNWLSQSALSTGLTLRTVAFSPDTLVRQSIGYIQLLFVIAGLISLLICVYCAYRISKYVFKPVNELAYAMKRITMGDLSTRIESNRKDEFGIVGSGFNSMVSQIIDLIASAKEEQQRLRIAEMKALQAQLNPHFIYNTLDLIKWNAKLNKTKEVNLIVVQLAKLLRGMIHVDEEETTLGAEMDLIENYLYIQRIRFEDRLFLDIRVDPGIRDARIPRLLLHPLVENAIVHGFENQSGNVYLSISAVAADQEIEFEIADNGAGIPPELLERIRSEQHQDGIGISNVHKRIQLYYGEACGLSIESAPGQGTRISFRAPYRRFDERSEASAQGDGH